MLNLNCFEQYHQARLYCFVAYLISIFILNLVKSMNLIQKTITTTMLAAGIISSANATTIISGNVIAQTNYPGWTAEHLLDQSGLSYNYLSGVTDFDSYVGAAPTHIGTSTDSTKGYFSPGPAVVDIDLGSSFFLTKFALWNDNDYQGVKDFNLLISDNSSFTGAVSLGSFSATYGPSGYSIPTAVQLFDLIAAQGRFVRINFTRSHGDNFINVGEVAFGAGANNVNTVPEPTSIALLGLGAMGLFAARRRKNV